MFTRSPRFIRMQSDGQRFLGDAIGSAWWLMMAPGVGLILMALAILLWPELLAYMVASALLFIGITLVTWSWRLRRAGRRWDQHLSTIERHDWQPFDETR
jgi:Flp pilus assembly protein TadB